jgi:hypothetical protein
VPLFAQTGLSTTRPTAAAPAFEASGGYVFMSTTSASTSRVNSNGANGDFLMQISERWAGMADFLYARTGNVSGTGHSGYLMSGLVGPVFYPIEHPRTGVFLHALVGIARVNSAVNTSPTSFYQGYETRFSYALGGGWEHLVSGPFALRIGGDYQRTTFVNSKLALEGQNNLRVTTSLVYRFGSR